jgi:TolB-like protein/DNA-binding winged helix-turn-helix (wHTH) protein
MRNQRPVLKSHPAVSLGLALSDFHVSPVVVRFGAFELDRAAGELRRDGVKVRLQELPFQVLQILLEQPGKVILRDELKKRIWPSDTFVDFDHGINNAIKRLREALQDTAETPAYIETLPRRGYRFKAAVDGLPSKLRTGSAPLDSVAVFRFETESCDPDTDYLAIGIPGGVIHALSQVPHLRVISWRSADSAQSQDRDPLAIGRKLGVRAVLTGRIWQRANKLRLHVDLLDAENGEEIWGDQYDSDVHELFAVQDSISREVSHRLRLKMTGETESRLVRHYTENIEAYQLYVKARSWCEKRSAEGFKRGMEYLSRAIEMDPNYALAHAELAQCISVPCYYGAVDPNVAYPKARRIAQRALELDPDLDEAHEVLATVLQNYDWDWPGAEKEYRRSIQLNPNYGMAHYHYSYHLVLSGRAEEAIREATEALSHEPMSSVLNSALAFVLMLARKYDDSIEQVFTAIEVDPNMTLSYWTLGVDYEQKGMYEEAVRAYEKCLSLGGGIGYSKAFIAHAHGKSGDRSKALATLRELQEASKSTYVPMLAQVIAYDGLMERELALESLRTSCDNRETNLVFLKTWPHFDYIRDDPRFQGIERLVGLRA